MDLIQIVVPQTFSEVAGVVSIARIERPQLHRGGSASTETMPAVPPFPSKLARFSLHRTAWLILDCAHPTYFLEDGLDGLPLRVSNEGLLRPRVARAQETV